MSNIKDEKNKVTEGWLVSGPKDEIVPCFVVYQREHVEIVLQALHEANKISDPDDFTATAIDHVCLVVPASVVQDGHPDAPPESEKKQGIGRYYREAIDSKNPLCNMRFGVIPTADLLNAFASATHGPDGYKFGHDLRAALESGPTSTEDPPIRDQGKTTTVQEFVTGSPELNIYGSPDHNVKIGDLVKPDDKNPSMSHRFDIVDKKS